MRRQNSNYSVQQGVTTNKPRRFRLGTKLITGLIITALFGAGVYVAVQPSGATNLVSFRSVTHAKRLRAIARHASRHVCTTPKAGRAWCMAEVSLNTSGQPLTGTPATSGGYGPAEFHTAYNLPCTPGGSAASICSTPSSFGPETIAIVDAGNFDTGTSGLDTSLQDYDNFYGLPTCSIGNGCLDVMNQSGSTSSLPGDAGWSDEIALDVETAHMVCQTCKIALVEATSDTISNLSAAEETAASLSPAAISNSWGSSADSPVFDADFEHLGIAVVAATGDNGTVSSGEAWPSDNPDVVAAAGTTLQLNTDNSWASESVWAESGGGCSDFYAAPSWQSGLTSWSTNGCGSFRAFGDVAVDGDPSTGAAININGTWFQIGGTSLSAPLIASMYALAGGVASGTTASSVPYASFTGSNSHDITGGNDCRIGYTTHCTAGSGFDTPTGLGSPNGVSGFVSLPTPPAGLTAKAVSQTQINLSWAASTANGGISDYDVYRNGVQVATVSDTSYSDTGLMPNTTYSYGVVAVATGGALSQASVTIGCFTAYPADINEDTHVNLLDLSLLANKYGQSGAGLGRADINGDGTVNLLDLSLLANKYGSE